MIILYLVGREILLAPKRGRSVVATVSLYDYSSQGALLIPERAFR